MYVAKAVVVVIAISFIEVGTLRYAVKYVCILAFQDIICLFSHAVPNTSLPRYCLTFLQAVPTASGQPVFSRRSIKWI